MAEAPPERSLPKLKCYQLQLLACFGKAGQREGDYHEARGVAISINKEIVLADHRYKCIQVFDMHGRHLREIKPPPSRTGKPAVPAKVAVSREGILHMTELSVNGVMIFNPELTDAITHLDYAIGENSIKVGFALDDMNNVLILEFEKGECTLAVHYIEGSTSGRFKLKKNLIKPNGLAAWNKMAYISDFESDFIEVFDYLGNYVGKFGREDLTKRALCICMSEYGELLVATETDVGFKLYKFLPDGTILRVYNCCTYQEEIRDMAVRGEHLVMASSFGVHVFKFIKDLDDLFGLDPKEGRKIFRRTTSLRHIFRNWVGEDLDVRPTGLAVDGSRLLYFPDAKLRRVLKFPCFAEPSGYEVKHNTEYAAFPLVEPGKIVVDRHQDNLILVIDKLPRARIMLIGRAIAGKKYLESEFMVNPLGLATDKRGNVYVIERLSPSLRVFNNKGALSYLLTCTGLRSPVDIVISEKDEIFIADNGDHCVKVSADVHDHNWIWL